MIIIPYIHTYIEIQLNSAIYVVPNFGYLYEEMHNSVNRFVIPETFYSLCVLITFGLFISIVSAFSMGIQIGAIGRLN